MSDSSDPNTTEVFADGRLLRIMTIVSVIAVTGSLWLKDWRVTSGLVLGCGLSFVNFLWARASIKAMFEKNATSAKPAFSVVRYFFRYLIFALVIGSAYYFDLVSVVAALLGLLTFITAIFITAFIQFFLFRREET